MRRSRLKIERSSESDETMILNYAMPEYQLLSIQSFSQLLTIPNIVCSVYATIGVTASCSIGPAFSRAVPSSASFFNAFS